MRICESTHRIDNFRRASGAKQGEFVGIYFNDSDVYKWLESAASALACPERSRGAVSHDPKLQKMVDDTIDLIAAAQQPDGYLNTYFMFDLAKERWTNLKDKHEMYCAWTSDSGGRRASSRNREIQNCLRSQRNWPITFATRSAPKAPASAPAFAVTKKFEMSLVELFRTTRDRKYLDQAKYFIDARGHGLIGGSEYHQDHRPVREVDRVSGHAVRQVYLACAMADLCAEIDDDALLAASPVARSRTWPTRRCTSPAEIGSRYEGEAFGRGLRIAERARLHRNLRSDRQRDVGLANAAAHG